MAYKTMLWGARKRKEKRKESNLQQSALADYKI